MIDNSINGNRRVLAVAAAAILIVAFAGTSVMVADDDNEIEAMDPVTLAVVALSISAAIGAAVGLGGGYLLWHGEGGNNDDEIRGLEAQAVAESIVNCVGLYGQSIETLEQVWTLTNEHHIRQAELAASELWQEGKEMLPYEILTMSGVYANSAYMLDNSAAQISALYDLVSESLSDWNQTETYKDKMELELNWGSGSMKTKSSFGLDFGTATVNVEAGADKVFLTTESTVWSSETAMITDPEGNSFNLSRGFNDLSEFDGFEDDMYTLQSGVTYCGDMMAVLDQGAAPLNAGAVMQCGDESKVAIYSDGHIIVDGKQSDDLSLAIHPEGAESITADITDIMGQFSSLMDTVYWTMTNSSSAASSVWGIYDKAGHASAYLSTLMVPNIYDGMEITQSQQELITILAMEQLASYWNENGDQIKTDDYMMSDSMSLFVRGDIIDSTGETLYEDVILTPFFYQDTSISTGTFNVQRQAILAIWGTGENLSSWDGLSDSDKAALMVAEPGYSIVVYEMKNQGQMTDHVDLTVNKISIIDPYELSHGVHQTDPDNDLDKIIMLALVLLGILILMSGWRSGNYIVMAIGVLMIAVGLLLSNAIEGLLYDWFGWRIELG